MSRFKKIIACVTILLAGLTGFSQETTPDDTLLIIDSMHQAAEAGSYEDTDLNESTAFNRLAMQPQMPDSLSFRKVSDSIASTLKKQKVFEYANDPAYWVRAVDKPESASFSLWKRIAEFFARPAVQNFVYLLLALIAIFLIIKIIFINNLYIFKSSKKKVTVTDNTSEAALMEENLDELISDAMQRNDQRAVVRFHYLKTLKLLDRKGWISFHPQATNQAYRAQVNNYAKGKEFGFLSSAYEHVWYGDFHLTEQQFEIVVHNFNHFQNALKV